MIRSHVIKLDPTHDQEVFFRKCVGTSRFAFNWALNRWRDQYAAQQKPNEGGLRKELNAIKAQEFPWMLDVPKAVVQQAVKNLGIAYQNFFDSLKGKRKGPKMSPPDFKSRHKSKQSARLDNGPGTFSFDGKHVRLPKIGTVKTHEALRFDGKPLSAVVSFVGGQWWLSVQVEIPDVTDESPRTSVGIDLGIKTALVLSDGTTFDAPKPLKAALERLRRLGRFVSRKVKGSANRKKAAARLGRQHWKVAQVRKDWTHKTTTAIAKQYGQVGLEDLNVKGMMSNHCLARAISDIGFSEIRRQLEYKAQKVVVVVNRWLPTSKTCSNCGCKKDVLALSERIFHCEHCGFDIDRDLNAARNIHTASCAVINACGDGSPGPGARKRTRTKLPSTKQELDRTMQMSTN